MLPRNAAKTTITVYTYIPSVKTFHRAVLHDCIWTQEKSAHRDQYGTALPDNIRIQIPYDYKYFSTQNGEEFDGLGGWTARMGAELEHSYIVKGDCSFRFPTVADMDEYVLTVIVPFEKKFRPHRPKRIEEHLTGSRNLWSIEVTV